MRNVVGVLVLLLIAPAAGATAPPADPVAVVKALYARDDIRAYDLYSARLKNLFIKDEPADGSVGNLDFMFYVNGQDTCDGWEKSLKFDLTSKGRARASVRVTFHNCEPQEIRYTLVREHGRWLIDEVESFADERWVLSHILRGVP